MSFHDTLPITPATAPDSSGATKEELLVDLHELLLPEILLVEYIRCKQPRGHAASEIFDALAGIAAFYRGIVSVSLVVNLV